jgi:ABC-type uncharacterized transport system permease subunit
MAGRTPLTSGRVRRLALMGFLLGFFLEACIGLIGFWFLEVSSLLFVYMLLNFFLSGHMFPLDMLPAWGAHDCGSLAAEVSRLFPGGRVSGQGKRSGSGAGLAIQAMWLAGTFIVAGSLGVSAGRAPVQRFWRIVRGPAERFHELIMRPGPSYLRVLMTFARNSLVRDMTFRANFLIEGLVGFLGADERRLLPDRFSAHLSIGADTGWGRHEFFVFLATTWLINSVVQAFFMPNAEEFSELIRTGNLDFALLKPIDTQFLISFQKVDWSSLANLGTGGVLLV